MPELTFEELSAFTTAFEPMCEALSRALSENINAGVTTEGPTFTQQAVDALMLAQTPVLQTTFSYPSVSPEEGVLAFSEKEAAVFVDLRNGGTGETPPPVLMDEHMNILADVMSGTVRGFGHALGSHLNQPVQPGPCATALEPLTLPPSFADTGTAVQIEIPIRIEGVMEGQVQLFVTPDTARALLHTGPSGDSIIPDIPGLDAAPAGNGLAGTVAPQGGYTPFDGNSPVADILPRGLDLLMDIPLDVTVELGRVQMLIKDVLELTTGSIVELERVAGEPVDLLVNGRLVAKGEVVVIEDNFGIRVTEIISPADRLNGLNKR